MVKPVKLKEILEAFDYPDSWEVYLNKETGEIIYLNEDDQNIFGALDDEREEDLEDMPRWQRNELPNLKRNREAVESGKCISLPDHFDINEWDIMRRFAMSVRNGLKKEQLLNAIHGRGAFRYFKDTVNRLGLAESWYRFRNHTFEEIAVDWLQTNDIPFTRD